MSTVSVPADRPSSRSSRLAAALRTRVRAAAPAAGPALVALGLGLWGIDRGSMYIGEEASYWAAKLSIPELFRMLGRIDAVHGSYYLLLHFVLSFGGGEVVLRIPSVLGMAGAVACTAATARRLGAPRRVAAMAGLLLAVAPITNQYGQSGRSYAIDMLAVASTGFVLLWTLDNPRWRRWLPYGALVAVSGYLHEMTTLMLLAHGVTLLLSRQPRAVLRRWALSAATALVVLTPLVVVSHGQLRQLGYVRPPSLRALPDLARALLGPSWVAVAVMGVLIVLGAFGIGRTRGEITVQQLALPLLLLPPAALLVESAVAVPLYAGSRYVLYCLPSAALLAAVGLERVVRRFHRTGPAWVAALCVVALVFGADWPRQQILRTPGGHLGDMAAAAEFLGAHAIPGEAVLYIPAGMGLAPLGYPQDYRAVTAIARARTPLQAADLYGSPLPIHRVVANIRARTRIWVVGEPNSAPGAKGKIELRVLRHHFRPAEHAHFPGVAVQLWVRSNHGAARRRSLAG